VTRRLESVNLRVCDRSEFLAVLGTELPFGGETNPIAERVPRAAARRRATTEGPGFSAQRPSLGGTSRSGTQGPDALFPHSLVR
jgi:hypothetical protein